MSKPDPSAPEQDGREALLCRVRSAFRAAPSFARLRKLAELWESTEHWELSAEAWLHVTRARPGDAQAFAHAAVALSHLAKYDESARMWREACRIQPNNQAYAHAYAQALRQRLLHPPQAGSQLDRTKS
jgi:tetratricopeptide (TPR) repeat protein